MTLRYLVTRASAFVPVAMSFAALGVVAGAFVVSVAHPPDGDEGAAAHIWQLLMVGQVPIIAFFALRWLPQAPRQGMLVLALQLTATLAALAPVFLLRL
jgi:hypothetical protein